MPSPRADPHFEQEALHALAHPLRVRILDELRSPASAAEVARRLGSPRQNLNYHLKALARAGLAERVGERRSGAFVEGLYQATSPGLFVAELADCDTSVGETGEPLPAAGRWSGVVHSLHVAPAAGVPMTTVEEVSAVAGRGLEGDRYFTGVGTFSKQPGTGRHITLIELEAVRALLVEHGVALDPGEARRNVVTCGVPLNHLVGREFTVGEVLVRGMRLCEPCTYLSGLVGKGVKAGLVHRGGLRAELAGSGTIRVGDTVQPC